MSLHFSIAWALKTIVPLMAPVGAVNTEVSKARVVEKYSDIANEYVALKYSNGYLKFWDNVHGRVDLKTPKVHGIYSDSKATAFFKSVKKGNGDVWGGLVTFCRRMKNKIEDGKDLSERELKNVGWCDKGDSISRSKEMNTRAYWVDMFARTRYKAEDFKFWDRLSEETHERVHKFHDLLNLGYRGSLQKVLGEAKSKCQVVRDKFEGKSKDKLTEEDLSKNIPICLSSLRAR